jgi:hypothetical protein
MSPGVAGQSVLVKGIAQGLSANAWIFVCLFLIPIPFALLNLRDGGKSARAFPPRRRQEGIFDTLAALVGIQRAKTEVPWKAQDA